MRLIVNFLILLLVACACRANPRAELQPASPTITPQPAQLSHPITTTEAVTAASQLAAGGLPAEYLLLYKEGNRLKSLPPRPVFDRPQISHIYDVEGESFGTFLQIAGPMASPDGRYVVLKAPGNGPPPPEPPTWLVDLEAGQVEKLDVAGHEAAGIGPVTWSPDGCCLTFVVEDTLYMRPIEAGGAPVPIFSHSGLVKWFARWSPTGDWIAVAVDVTPVGKNTGERDYSYWLISPDRVEQRNLGTYSIGGYGVVPYNLDWSADGSRLLTPSHQILMAEGQLIADGPSADYLTDPTAWIPRAWTDTFVAQTIQPQPWQQPGNYRLSPSGQQLAYSTYDDVAQQSQIYIFNRSINGNRLIDTISARRIQAIRWTEQEDFLVIEAPGLDRSKTALILLDTQAAPSSHILVEGDDLRLVDIIPNSAVPASAREINPTAKFAQPTPTPTPTVTLEPFISPDASKIVFLADYQLHTLDTNTGEVTSIKHDHQAVLEDLGVSGSFYCPQWSPDRQQIALSIYGGMSSGLYLLNVDGSRPRLLGHQRLPHGEGTPDIPVWSPDGRTIKMAGVWLDAGTEQSVEEPWRDGWVWAPGAQVTPSPENAGRKQVQRIHTGANEWGSVWSPDGQQVAFLSDRAGQADIYLADVNNTEGRRLTNTPAEERPLTWSPDGSHLLYIAVARKVRNSISFDIYVMNNDGSDQNLLAEGVILRTGLSDCHYPVWSPDSRHVAFMENDTIFIIDADGTNPRKLLTWPGGYMEFDW